MSMEQGIIPELPPIVKEEFTNLTDMEMQAIRKALIDANGNMEKAGIDLKTMRNALYTARMKANPMQDTPSEKLPKAAKKSKEPSTNVSKLSGEDVNNFLG